MIGYIYHIKCETTGKEYIGITEDIRRRFNHHRSDLRLNKHHSPKLQAAWNYYGEEDFTFSYRKVTIQKERNSYNNLSSKEKEEYIIKVRLANLEQLENLKEQQKRLSGGSV